MDRQTINIADVLRHPRAGLVSYQPEPSDLCYDADDDKIRVRDIYRRNFFVSASECEIASATDHNLFWFIMDWSS